MATKSAASETTKAAVDKGGRPKKEISKKTFQGLLDIGATQEEICTVLGISRSTLSRWCQSTYGEGFAQVHKKGSSSFKVSVRRNLFNLSKRSSAAAIFLSKQTLGYTDNPVPIPSGTEQQTFQRALSKAAKLWDGDAQPVMATDGEESTDDAGAGQ